MNMENLNYEEIKGMEAEISARRNEVTPTYQHYGSAENLSDREIVGVEAEIASRRNEVTPTYQHYGSAENLSDREIVGVEAEIAARRNETTPTYQHYGSPESLSDREIMGMEAEIAARRKEVTPTYQHYGSVESLNDSDLRALEAQVVEQRKNDAPHKEYFEDLINNPNIINENDFNQATIRSMQSNRIMRTFIDNLFEKISSKSYELKNVDKNDLSKIQYIKKEIENYIKIYQKYMYTLKENNWNFNDIYSMKLPEDIKEDLWRLERSFNISFNLPIPANLGEYYGDKYEREGRMIPTLNMMYDDLGGKQVNWHQVLIYKENELTPRERYQQSQEEKRRQFEQARKEEISNNLSKINVNTLEEEVRHL